MAHLNVNKAAPEENPPGELADYQPGEISGVKVAANGKKFLVRKGLTPQQIEELKAQGISVLDEEPAHDQLAQSITQNVMKSLKSLLPQFFSQKGNDPMSTQANKNEQGNTPAAAAKALTDEDWTKIGELVDTKVKEALVPVTESISAVTQRVDTLEKNAGETAETAAAAADKAAAAAGTAAETQETTKSLTQVLAQQTELLTKAFNARPAGNAQIGSQVPEQQNSRKSVWGASPVMSALNQIG
ncbi:MAG: hypothetical protein ACO1RX_20125 [Candidatus Sericytochromatia bacterium]